MDTKHYPFLAESATEKFIQVEGREYHFSQGLLPSSIKVGEQELLACPMQLVLGHKGEESVFENSQNFSIQEEQDKVSMIGTAETPFFYANTHMEVEEDGCVFVTLSLMPRGYSVRQIFGLDPKNPSTREIDHFWLEASLRKDLISFYHVAPDMKLFGNFPKRPKELAYSDFIPEGGFSGEFGPQLLLLGNHQGLGFFFESNEGWEVAHETKSFEVIEQEDSYLVRIHFLDCTPSSWGNAYQDADIADRLIPVSFKFGFVATPLKKMPQRAFTERSLHIDCFKKIWNNYEEFLANPVVEGDSEIGFDRIKRLGVKTLYIHEKWNDIQNSPILTDLTKKRLSYIVDECHKRDIRVIPYFGYEISTLSPYFAQYGRKILCIDSPDAPVIGSSWNRVPGQRALRVCQNGPWGQIFTEGVKKLVEEFNLDGIYLDCMLGAFDCGNLDHGCGYVKKGKVVKTYSWRGVRNTLRELNRFITKRGGTINLHGYGSMTLPGLYYGTTLWEGENFQGLLMRGEISEMPEGHLRAMYTGYNIGLPVYSLCYSNPPTWTYSEAISMALLHNSMPKPVDIGAPLEETSCLWDIYDLFPMQNASWHPYFSQKVITSTSQNVKISYYVAGKQLLVIAATTDKKVSEKVKIDLGDAQVKFIENLMTHEMLSSDSKIELEFNGFKYYVLGITLK